MKESKIFYSSVFFVATCIGLSMPTTNCTAERSFNMLQRFINWLRSTIVDERLDALCVMNVHTFMVNE